MANENGWGAGGWEGVLKGTLLSAMSALFGSSALYCSIVTDEIYPGVGLRGVAAETTGISGLMGLAGAALAAYVTVGNAAALLSRAFVESRNRHLPFAEPVE